MKEYRKQHQHDSTDIKLGQMEFRIVMGDIWSHLDKITNFIYCDCISTDNRLVDYTPYLTKLNDILLRGNCSSCGRIAARYIETGDSPDCAKEAKRIRKEFVKSQSNE
jgi:hypothetical protein